MRYSICNLWCGKEKILKVLKSSKWKLLDVFKNPKASHKEIADADEKLISALFAAPKSCASLEKLRYL